MKPLKEEKKNRLNLISSEEYVKEYFEGFKWNGTSTDDIQEYVLELQKELMNELKKAQEEKEELKEELREEKFNFNCEVLMLSAEIERLKGLFQECWKDGEVYGDWKACKTISKLRPDVINPGKRECRNFEEWKKDKGIN
jgi:hypothetical protein